MSKILLHGTEAICEGAMRNGCRAFFGYPITPQNEVPEYMSVQMPKVGGVFVQAESEVAAINMVYGAAGAGVRAMTSSSSPGVSLKQEGISYIACARIPCVVVNIMRAGPGLGGIQPAQGDYFQATKGGGHGETEDAEIVLTAYGTVARICKSVVNELRAQGVKAGCIRPITLYPFPDDAYAACAAGAAKAFLSVELSLGQMVEDVKLAVNGKKPVYFYGRTGGNVPDEEEIIGAAKRALEQAEAAK